MSQIQIVVNGNKSFLPKNFNISQTLNLYGYTSASVAVALNGTFIARDSYEDVMVKADDDMEIVAPMQGG